MITELLPDAIALGRSGKCTSCGSAIAPWFTTCRPCSGGPAGRSGGNRDRRPGGQRSAGRALGGRQGGPRGRSRRG